MDRPKIIIHNTISLDGSYTGFPVDMGLHYRTAAKFNADAHLIGSATAKSGIEEYYPKMPPEKETDKSPPKLINGETRPYFVIIDSRGELEGMLHLIRKSGYCKDIIILASKSTPHTYITYLRERGYGIVICGKVHVDLGEALVKLKSTYGINTMITDTGSTLVSILIKEGLADEISLVIAPELAQSRDSILGESQKKDIHPLKLIRAETIGDSHVWLHYAISKPR